MENKSKASTFQSKLPKPMDFSAKFALRCALGTMIAYISAV